MNMHPASGSPSNLSIMKLRLHSLHEYVTNVALFRNMILKEVLNRRSVREFTSEPVPDIHIQEIIRAGQFAPSAKGAHAVEYVVVKNSDTRNSIFEIVGQDFVKQAPVLIVPVCDTIKSEYCVEDLSVASENMFLQAVASGLGTIWKNIKKDEAAEIRKILGIPENFAMINVIPLGFPKEKQIPHGSGDFFPNKIHEEKWLDI